MKKRELQRFLLIILLAGILAFLTSGPEIFPIGSGEGLQNDFVHMTMGKNGLAHKAILMLVEMATYSLEG